MITIFGIAIAAIVILLAVRSFREQLDGARSHTRHDHWRR